MSQQQTRRMNVLVADKVEKRLSNICTLPMLKMEKNFVAVIEKGYPRQPYSELSIEKLLRRYDEECQELADAYAKFVLASGSLEKLAMLIAIKKEVADCQNMLDYVIEKLALTEQQLRVNIAISEYAKKHHSD